jgi:hypothetical protein
MLIPQDLAAASASAAGVWGRRFPGRVYAIQRCGEIAGGGCFPDSLFTGKEQGMGNACFADDGLQEANRKGLPYNGVKSGHGALALRERVRRQHFIVCGPVWSVRAVFFNGSAAGLVVHTFFKLFTRFEKRKLFWLNGHFIAGLGISAHIAFIVFNKKAAQSPDFDTFATGHGLRHAVEKNLDHFCCFRFRYFRLVFQRGNKLQFIHGASFFQSARKTA